LFYGLGEALQAIREEGARNRWSRHRRHHERLVHGLKALGLEMLVPEGQRIWNLNTVRVPEGINDVDVRAQLTQRHGIEILGGFGPLAGKVFRIGLMGPLASEHGTDQFLSAFAEALAACGYRTPALAR